MEHKKHTYSQQLVNPILGWPHIVKSVRQKCEKHTYSRVLLVTQVLGWLHVLKPSLRIISLSQVSS